MVAAVLAAIVVFAADHKTILMGKGRLVVIAAAGPHKTIVALVELPVVVEVYRTAAVAVVAYQRIVVVEFQMAAGGRSSAVAAAPIARAAGEIHMTSVAAVVAAVDFPMVAIVERQAIAVVAAGFPWAVMVVMGKNQTVVAVLEERRSPPGMAARARNQVAVVEADKQKTATTGPLWSSHYLTMMFPQ